MSAALSLVNCDVSVMKHDVTYSDLRRNWITACENMERGDIYHVTYQPNGGIAVTFDLRKHWGASGGGLDENPRSYFPLEHFPQHMPDLQGFMGEQGTRLMPDYERHEINLRGAGQNQYVIENWAERSL